MATHVIDVDPFNPASVRRANAEYRRILREFDRNVTRFIAEIAQIGRDAAAGAYGPAISVTLQAHDNGITISADGRGIVFLEFGAGDAVNSGNRYANQMPFEVRPGSWSENHAQQYSTLGYWIFGGVVYREIQPRNGMQTAYDEIMANIRAVAGRVFNI